MKAMILAAGLGTRLKPLTDTIPKALVPFRRKPILEHLILRLKQAGITEIIINLHHFPDQITAFLQTNNYFGIRIEVSLENELLDTGGGLKKAQWFFDDHQPFLLHNVDIISNLDLDRMLDYHRHEHGLVTLAVRSRSTSRYLLFDRNNCLCGWEDREHNEKKIVLPDCGDPEPCSFMGIHIISPEIFTLLPAAPKFPIIGTYLDLAARKNLIVAFRADQYTWVDLGRIENLRSAEHDPEI